MCHISPFKTLQTQTHVYFNVKRFCWVLFALFTGMSCKIYLSTVLGNTLDTVTFLSLFNTKHKTVANPGFPVGGGGRGLPRRIRFENFVYQNERIWTLRGERAPGTPP